MNKIIKILSSIICFVCFVIHDAQYDNKEEKRVITGSEAKTAKSNHEALRRNHRGRNYKTTSPISTKSSK